MIHETIRQIEARLRDTALPPDTRAELLALVTQLKDEARHLPESTAPQPESQEAGTLQEDVTRLRQSVEKFEGEHPQLVQTVNHLANTLAGLGI